MWCGVGVGALRSEARPSTSFTPSMASRAPWRSKEGRGNERERGGGRGRVRVGKRGGEGEGGGGE